MARALTSGYGGDFNADPDPGSPMAYTQTSLTQSNRARLGRDVRTPSPRQPDALEDTCFQDRRRWGRVLRLRSILRDPGHKMWVNYDLWQAQTRRSRSLPILDGFPSG